MRDFYGDITVRGVTPADASVWEAMRRNMWPDGAEDHAPEIAMFLAGTLAEPSAVMVAETAASVPVGVVDLSLRTDVAGLEGVWTGYVEGLYVMPVARRQGVARKLLLASRSWSRQQKCDAFASDRAGRVVIDRNF